jgi:RNA polymerase sigma-70 factor (ECF subfamily)
MSDERRKENEVLAAARTHDGPEETPAQDLTAVFEEHHRQIFHAAYRVTGNAQDAEDVLQTVFLRLARRGAAHGLRDNPGGYLHRSAVNAALDVVRSRKSARVTALENVEAVLSDDDPNRAPDRRQVGVEILEHVRAALGRLNPRTAEVFALRYLEGYGNHEIADMLGTSRSTIAVMLHRARHKLKDEIRSLAGDAS